jgi:hypothetical protein
MKSFKENEFSVIREHEEFVWLHDRFVENDDFAGYIVSFFLKKGIRIIKIKFHSFRFHQHHLNLILMRHVKNFSV